MQLSHRIPPDSKIPSIRHRHRPILSHPVTPHPIANTPDDTTPIPLYFLAPALAFFPSLSSISLSSPSPFPRFFFPARAVALVGVAFPLPSLPKLAEMGVGAPEGVVCVDSPPGESYKTYTSVVYFQRDLRRRGQQRGGGVHPYHEICQPDTAPRKHPIVLADALLPPPHSIARNAFDIVVKPRQHIPMWRVLEVFPLLLVNRLVQRHLPIC